MNGIRAVVPPHFAIGIKLNAADYAHGGSSDEKRVLQHLVEIASWSKVDFIEVSGGNYESPGLIYSPIMYNILSNPCSQSS